MQIATISDPGKVIPDSSTERVSSLMTRVGARAIALQNQQQFARYLADEQTNPNTNEEKGLDRTAKSNALSENEQNRNVEETTTTRDKDPVCVDRGIREAQFFDEDPPPRDDMQVLHEASTATNPVSEMDPNTPDSNPAGKETTSIGSDTTVDDSKTSDVTVPSELLALAALQSPPIILHEIKGEALVVSPEANGIQETKNNPLAVLSTVDSQMAENVVTKGVLSGTTELSTADNPQQNLAKPVATEIPLQPIKPLDEDGNLVLAQITDLVETEKVSSGKSEFSLLLAASGEAIAEGNTKAVKDGLVAAASSSAENLVITGTQTASGKSLTEMAVTFLPSNGRGGENAGPEDVAVSSENRSSGTTTPVVGLQTLNSTKSLFSVRSGTLAGASNTTMIVDMAAETVRYMSANGEKSMTVRLSPASLGDMRIEVSTVNDVLNVKLVSGNSTARELLNQQVDLLRDTLAQGGLEVGSVTVTSGFGSTPNSHLSQQQSGAWSQGSSSSPPGAISLTGMTEEIPVTRSRRVANYNGALDVSV